MISSSNAPLALASLRVIALVGFMGSGKSSVGTELAQRLGWSFIDVDEEVEARTGSSIEALFEEVGEGGFREVEARVTAELLEGRQSVLATGGGWPAAEPGRLEALPRDVLSVWLQVAPEVALGRISRSYGRPLLDVEDPMAQAKDLLGRREGAYRQARLHLDTNRESPPTLADAIIRYVSHAES